MPRTGNIEWLQYTNLKRNYLDLDVNITQQTDWRKDQMNFWRVTVPSIISPTVVPHTSTDPDTSSIPQTTESQHSTSQAPHNTSMQTTSAQTTQVYQTTPKDNAVKRNNANIILLAMLSSLIFVVKNLY